MGKTKPQKSQSKGSKNHEKSVLSPGGSTISKQKPAAKENETANDPVPALLDQATILLETGQIEKALELANMALDVSASSPSSRTSSNLLAALNLGAEIYVEIGDIENARELFEQAVQLDPTGTVPEEEGGGADKFLWLAQLSEAGGSDSVRWFEKGVAALRQSIQRLQDKSDDSDGHISEEMEDQKRKLANALCGVAETYMTDLS